MQSCNWRPWKRTFVKEIDALDGIMAKATDRSCIQFRMLNSSRGLLLEVQELKQIEFYIKMQ